MGRGHGRKILMLICWHCERRLFLIRGLHSILGDIPLPFRQASFFLLREDSCQDTSEVRDSEDNGTMGNKDQDKQHFSLFVVLDKL